MRGVLAAVDQHLLRGIARAQAAQQVEPIGAGQCDLQDHQLRLVLARQSERGGHVGGFLHHLMAHVLQQITQCATHDRRGVGEQHRSHRVFPVSSSGAQSIGKCRNLSTSCIGVRFGSVVASHPRQKSARNRRCEYPIHLPDCVQRSATWQQDAVPTPRLHAAMRRH